MNKIKRNVFLVSLSVIALTMGVATTVSAKPYLSEIEAANSYTMTLNSSNGNVTVGSYSGKEQTVNATTASKQNVKMGFVNGLKKDKNVVQLKSGKGIYYNIDAITNITKVSVSYTNGKSLGIAVSNSVNPIDYVEYTSSPAVFTCDGVDDYYFAIKAVDGASYVSSITIEYSCTTYISGETGPVDPTPGPDTSTSESSSSEATPTDEPITITMNATNKNGRPTNNKYGSANTTAKDSKGNNINFSFTQVNPMSIFAQLKNSSGSMWNTTALPKLSKIVADIDGNGPDLTYGDSANNLTNTVTLKLGINTIYLSQPASFFKLTAANGYVEIHSLEITYNCVVTDGGGQESNPNPDSGTDPDPHPDIPGGGEIVTPGNYQRPTAPLTGYYSSIDINASGAKLLSETRDVIVGPHKKYTSYDDCTGSDNNGYYHQTDADPKNPSNLIMFYTHASINVPWASGTTYNREHVWPKSLSCGNYSTSNGGSDLHHIRPDFKATNGTRSNQKFGESNGSLYTYSYNGITYDAAHEDGSVWEPMDFAKGDVARIVLYMLVHYNNATNLEANDGLTGQINSHAVSNGSANSMPITKVVEGSTSSALALMLKWHKLDPVDELEINRNNAIAAIQGNRNAFIDQPWLVEAIWG